MAAERTFYERLLDGISDGVYFMDRDRIIRYWNRGAERITGFNRDEVLGKACRDNVLVHVDEKGRNLCLGEFCPAYCTIMDGRERQVEVYLHHKKGFRLPVTVRILPIRDDSGEITGAVEAFSDNRRMRELADRIQELERLALIDPLTKIGNRRYGETRLQNGFDQLHRYGWTFGILFMDIDHFKKVNDSHGHGTGDNVLQIVAGTLLHNLRPSDSASRWGGEEFLVVLPHVDRNEIGIVGKKLRALIEKSSVETDSGGLSVTVSIGAALARQSDSMISLVERADQLMYQSKRRGRNTITIED